MGNSLRDFIPLMATFFGPTLLHDELTDVTWCLHGHSLWLPIWVESEVVGDVGLDDPYQSLWFRPPSFHNLTMAYLMWPVRVPSVMYACAMAAASRAA
jgi:hypothetical protein